VPLLTIDDTDIEVPEGTTILSAAERLGIDIPVFCYHQGLSIAGNCRMCLVEVVGNPRPVASCEAKVSDGMRVLTQSAMAARARESMLEFTLVNHPIDCPVCDCAGECLLQDHYYEHSAKPSRINVRKVHKEKRLVIGETVVLDKERCINCTRCVRFCEEVSKSNQLIQVKRGDATEITLFPGQEFTDPYSLCTVDLCPVGALTSRDFRFKKRVWWLKQAAAICPECARGCAVTVDYQGDQIYRVRPRFEARVNQWWACDHGRLAYAKFAANRVTTGQVGVRTHEERTLTTRDAAIAGGRWLYDSVAAGGSVAVVLDACLSVEEGYAALSFARNFIGTERVHLAERPQGVEDEVLRRPQQASNAAGLYSLAEHLGVQVSPASGLFDGEQKWTALMGFGAEIELPRPRHPEQVGRVLLFAWRHNQVTRVAHTLLPLPAHYEKRGHYLNFEGVLQESEVVVQPPEGVLDLPSLLTTMASDRKIELDYKDSSQLLTMSLATLRGEGGSSG